MTIAVVVDTGPLGLISNPRANEETRTARVWLEGLLNKRINDLLMPENG